MNAHFCPQCDSLVSEGARFCASCGTDLAPSGSPTPESPAPAPVAPVQSSPGPPTPSEDQAPQAATHPRRRRRGCILTVILVLLVSVAGVGALLASAGALEWLKPLESVTFATLDQFATGRRVTLTGKLSGSASITCYDNGKSCPVELVDATDTTVGPGLPRTIFIYFDRSALESGPKVHLTSGGLAETGAVVRVTGRVCRTLAEPPEACVIVEQIESAGGPTAGASSGTATPTPGPTPTAAPTPTPDPAIELAAACEGTPVPWAAPYAGKLHPLVVVDIDGIPASYAINKKWRNGTWTSPIQLVVCVPDPTEASVKVGSCGRWQRQSDNVGGELMQYRYRSTIRVVVAKTGKILQKSALYGSVPPCGDAPEDQWSIPDMGDDPPWHLFGVEVTPAQIDKYATTVSKQAVK